MQINATMVGAGVAAAVATGLGYLFLSHDDEPHFATVERDGAFSVRDYPRLTVAETVSEGRRESALSRGFLALADYISGKASGGRRIKMTVPVLADGDEDGRGWRTRFVMPARLSAEALPAPGEGIVIRSRAASPRCGLPARPTTIPWRRTRTNCVSGSPGMATAPLARSSMPSTIHR